MAMFMGVHNVAGADEEKLIAAWEEYKASCDKHGIEAKHAHYNAEKGVAFCFTEAQTEDEVRKAHEGMAVPLEDLYEVKTAK